MMRLLLLALLLLPASFAQAQRITTYVDSSYAAITRAAPNLRLVALTASTTLLSQPSPDALVVDTLSAGTLVLPYSASTQQGVLYRALAMPERGHVGWVVGRTFEASEARAVRTDMVIPMSAPLTEEQWRAAMLETARKNERNTRVMKYIMVGSVALGVLSIVAAIATTEDADDDFRVAPDVRPGIALTW
jgi:hypothetical protein